jgi:hypothetical protein
VAADLREALHADVETEDGHYGEFKIFVDGEEVVTGGAFAFIGVMPSVDEVRALVKQHLDSKPPADSR